MERPAPPLLTARLIGAGDDLAKAIGHALGADGARLVESPADEDSAGLDILVFIAPDTTIGPIAKTTAIDFSGQVGASLRAAFLALQTGVSSMRAKGGGGSVVFVAPPAGQRRAFDALTQGLRLMTKAAALELGPEKIRVNIVLPGSGENPLGRPYMPADIAAVVAFAASGRSRFMTGADLVIDGGALAR
ncbi:SDR family oxidoreductase [Phenylobacterium sp.]|uniref:SDR family oxidoreductase n=1 Tax=Phenylobacterium sp. TaxID=1871053 RepID=UPI0025DAD18C|nr:SDR family oxidoreductase [Phenylobacterium sp.]